MKIVTIHCKYIKGKNKMSHVWIIEILIDGKWEPTYNNRDTRAEAVETLKDRFVCVGASREKFRVKKYVRSE